jgi:hypothetical protein
MSRYSCLVAVHCLAACFIWAPSATAIAASPSPEDKQVDNLAKQALDTTNATSFDVKMSAIDTIGQIGAKSSESASKLDEILKAGLDKNQQVATDDQRPLYLLHAISAAQRVGPDAIVTATNLSNAKGAYSVLGPYVDLALDAITKGAKKSPAPTASSLTRQLSTLAAAMEKATNYTIVIPAMSDVMQKSSDPVQRQVAAQFAWNAIQANGVKPTPPQFLEGLTNMLAPLKDTNTTPVAQKSKINEQILAAQMFGQASPDSVPKVLLDAANSTDPGLKAVAQNALDTIAGKKAAAPAQTLPAPNAAGSGDKKNKPNGG